MSNPKQVSVSCDRNKEPILTVIRNVFSNSRDILEIGSGTGQHAIYFAAQLPTCTWHPSDLEENHTSIGAWIADSGLSNVKDPVLFDALDSTSWPSRVFDGIFTANTTHIMNKQAVAGMFSFVGDGLKPGDRFCQYGPFKYNHAFTTPSNEQFDHWLKERDPDMGIRDIEWLKSLASAQDLHLEKDHALPANNQLLVWKKNEL